MELSEDLRQLSEQVKKRQAFIKGEEATKQALILPFLQTLGYDIYDPTDGSGDFSSCPAPLSFVPKTPSDWFFGNWNAVASDEIPKHPGALVEPLHATFHQHGVIDPPNNWFYKDCIHPNAKGHDAIRGMFYQAITGEMGPPPPM